jgi:hypothetical protein
MNQTYLGALSVKSKQKNAPGKKNGRRIGPVAGNRAATETARRAGMKFLPRATPPRSGL